MTAHEELNIERPLEAGADPAGNGAAEPAKSAASRDDRAEKPADPAESPGAAPTAPAACESSPRIEAPRDSGLIPYVAPSHAEAAARWLGRWGIGLAAGLALIAAVAAAGAYDHARQSSLLAAKADESRSLAQTVKVLKGRIDAIEAARARDESADLRKLAAEIKAESGAARDLGGALAQLTARVDRVDHDQSARLDKLADRIDHESTARIADLSTRLDKLEKKQAGWRRSPTPASPTKRPARSQDRRRRCAAIGSSKSRTASRSSTAATARNKSRPAMFCPARAGCSESSAAATGGSW